jgi:hypothetical protein
MTLTLKTVGVGDPEFDDVMALGDAYKQTLGFLPWGGFVEAEGSAGPGASCGPHERLTGQLGTCSDRSPAIDPVRIPHGHIACSSSTDLPLDSAISSHEVGTHPSPPHRASMIAESSIRAARL